jgi:hypothetical protein
MLHAHVHVMSCNAYPWFSAFGHLGRGGATVCARLWDARRGGAAGGAAARRGELCCRTGGKLLKRVQKKTEEKVHVNTPNFFHWCSGVAPVQPRRSMAWGRLKGMFGAGPKGQHLTGVMDLPGVQMAESSEDLYQTVRQVGAGQTAIVYEGVRRADGVHYALKHFTELRGDKEAIRAFRAEVETLRELGSHRFIVSLQGVVSTPTAAIVVMELVSGGDLLSPIERNGPYSERRAQHVFAQIVHAVRHLHSLGIVHRDLKPENICFTTSELQVRVHLQWVRVNPGLT